MSSASTRYTARFQLPDLIERGRDELIACPVYLDDTLQLPSAGSVTVYDRNNTAISTPTVTFPGSIATATIPSAAAAALDFAEGWRVAWLLTMPDTVQHRFENTAALVRKRLYPTITGVDINRKLRALTLSAADGILARTNHQDTIDEADVELQNRLIEMGRRPWLVVTPTALRQTYLNLSIALIFESLAAQNPAQYSTIAAEWRQKYEEALGKASVQFDYDQDGSISDTEVRQGLKHPVVYL